MSPDAYFEIEGTERFLPTAFTRGPWDVDACHAGPPTALMARASERLIEDKPLVRLVVEIRRPIPMTGFSVRSTLDRNGRVVATTTVEIHDGDKTYARAWGLHLASHDIGAVETHHLSYPSVADSVPGRFPITVTHSETGFDRSLEVRYGPASSQGAGGETFMWARTKVPLLAGEEPSGFQMLCPLADCGNGISWHEPTDRMSFVNADLVLSVHRPPVGEWMGSHSVSFWESSGIGRADARLFDESGPVGSAMQNLVLRRV